MKTLQLALSALFGAVLLIVEGERMLRTGSDGRNLKPPHQSPAASPLTQEVVEQYLSDLMDLVLPGLAIDSKGRKPVRRRSKK